MKIVKNEQITHEVLQKIALLEKQIPEFSVYDFSVYKEKFSHPGHKIIIYSDVAFMAAYQASIDGKHAEVSNMYIWTAGVVPKSRGGVGTELFRLMHAEAKKLNMSTSIKTSKQFPTMLHLVTKLGYEIVSKDEHDQIVFKR
jgi:hypothetical protein